MCQMNNCTKVAVHRFKEIEYTTSLASVASEYKVISDMDFCHAHFDVGQQLGAGKQNVYIDLSKA